jgi:hypothetical protein
MGSALLEGKRRSKPNGRRLALSRLKTAVGLIDDVETATAAHHAIVAVTLAKRSQRILDLHY